MNKYVIIAIAFIAGGFTTYFILPSKTETITETKNVEKVVHEKTETKKQKITKPSGEIIETEVTQVDSKTGEKSQEKTFKHTEINKKKILVYAGLNPLKPTERDYLLGFSYNFWASLEVGAQYQKVGNELYGTIGIRF